MPSLSKHKHFRIIKIRSHSVYDHVFVRLIICQPFEVFVGYCCKVNPDSSVFFNKPDSQQIRLLLNCLSSSSFYDIFKLLHVRDVLMNVFPCNKIDSPIDLLRCSRHFLVTNPGDEWCFFEVCLPVHPNNFREIHDRKCKTWNKNQADYKKI